MRIPVGTTLFAVSFSGLVLTSPLPARAEQQVESRLGQTEAIAAQRACHKYDRIAQHLEKKYSETPTSRGLQTNGNLLQVFASESGSWTIVTTSPSGIACILAAGKAWDGATVKAPSAAL